jgi:hypothetical protein
MTVGDFGPTMQAIDNLMTQIPAAVHSTLEWYGDTATKQMKADHERDAHEIQRYINRTFYLTNTISADVSHPNEKVTRLIMIAPPWYAEAVEEGTPYSRAYPFFWIAVYGVQEEALMRLDRAFNDVFKAAVLTELRR